MPKVFVGNCVVLPQILISPVPGHVGCAAGSGEDDPKSLLRRSCSIGNVVRPGGWNKGVTVSERIDATEWTFHQNNEHPHYQHHSRKQIEPQEGCGSFTEWSSLLEAFMASSCARNSPPTIDRVINIVLTSTKQQSTLYHGLGKLAMIPQPKEAA